MSDRRRMKQALRYVRLRHQGFGAREAGRQAGYSGGKASPLARQLWRMSKTLAEHPELCAANDFEIQRLEGRRERLRGQLRAIEGSLLHARRWRAVCDVLQREQGDGA